LFAIKIRKSELDLINLLAGGVYDHPTISAEHAGQYLIVTPAPNNGKPTISIVSEREFDAEYSAKVSNSGPTLMKLNKRAS
jgi:hypothetical protein